MNKIEIHIKPTKVFGFDAYRMKVGTQVVVYRVISDMLLDIARTYEPPSTSIHEGAIKAQVATRVRKRDGKRGFAAFVLTILEPGNTLTCSEIAKIGHEQGDTRPTKSYAATLRNLEKAGKIKSIKKKRPFLWYIPKYPA